MRLSSSTTTTTMLMILLRSSAAFGFRAPKPHRTNIRRWPIATAFSTKASSVEVSPSNHGTLPLSDFRSSSILDQRLITTLQSSMNITDPTPIQSHAIPLLLHRYDVMASSATGSGKTIMFGLPLLQKVIDAECIKSSGGVGVGQPSSLVIAPTREVRYK